MIIYPVKHHRPGRGKKKTVPAGPPAPPGVMVAGVTVDPTSPLHVTVTFAGGVEYVGPGLPENFQVQVSGGEFLPVADVLDGGEDWIEVLILAAVEVGSAWRIVGPMDGVVPAVAWPQAGVVVAG